MESVTYIAWIVSFVIVTVAVTGFAGRFGVSAPLALVAIGAAVSFIPAVPTIEIEPDLVLYGVLPPLLFAAAIRTSFIDIKARGDSILLLSVGLVAFTFVFVGFTTWLVLPSIGLAAALAFGAVVAPTDAVAVTAIAGRLRLPRRLVTILEGESLLNDAVALVALSTSITAIVGVVDAGSVTLELLLAVGVGCAVGLGIGFVIAEIRKRLSSAVLDTSLSLVTPYLAFIPAQLLHGSGVLAVVLAGLFLGYRSPSIQSAEARIAESLNWRTIRFLLENAVFLLIGLSLYGIVQDAIADSPGFWPSIGIGGAVLAAVFLSRVIWIALTTVLYRVGPSWLRERQWRWRNSVAVMVSGIRGVVTLIAVFLLPEETPYRGFLQLLAFVVIAGSLLAGLWLPWVIRKLRLPAPNIDQEQMQRRLLMAEAHSAGLQRLEDEVTDDVEELVTRRLRINATFLTEGSDAEEPGPRLADYTRLRHAMIEAEREAVRVARSEGRYEEYAVRAVLAAIDAEELALKATAPRSAPEVLPGPVPSRITEDGQDEGEDPDARADEVRRAAAVRRSSSA
ncbi:sodium:proton antiporter [Naasia sp. SYSU D00057]|uniref:cation:proton antiporter n=1 Tax=Naasia sp. SYSU D00057 TaxID=2817380 RepID=UPI0027DE23BE|nr:sodium:proton antiporter [Naasia sp. SYSU D00057]